MSETISGGCLCGACCYLTEAEAINVRVCHCRACQKATGASFYARVLVPLAGLRVAGPIAWYASSDDLRRGFCPRCGSTLFSERSSTSTVGLSMGTLDDPGRFRPAEHIWVSSMQSWIEWADGLPRHAGGLPTVP